MRVERIRAAAFGPLINDELELAPGMNVIYGPNESGKSSWHGALFAALCGIRRSRGRLPGLDQQWADRHRPWDGDAWAVSAIVQLADDRRIEIRQNLATRMDCRAMDLTLGRDVSDEFIMSDGSLAATKLLGLDRHAFVATACVRQADVLVIQESAGALQEALQRAAASARAESTAAAALARLDEFEHDQIGTQRAPTRPLRQAQALVDEGAQEVERAEREHEQFLDLSQQVEEARELAEVAERQARAATAARAMLDADALTKRLDEARQILTEFPEGEPIDMSSDEDDARLVATTLDRWERRPERVPLTGEPSTAIRERIVDLTGRSQGDLDVHESVKEAWADLNESRAILRQVDADRPTELPAPDTRGASVEELYGYARVLSTPRMDQGSDSVSPAWMVAVSAFAVAGLVALAVGFLLPGVALLSAAAATVGARFLLRVRPAKDGPAGESVDGLYNVERGLPEAPEALRVLAQELSTFEQRQEDIRTWLARRQAQSERVEAAERALRAALASRGVEVEEAHEVTEAFQAYERACKERWEVASHLQRAQAALQAREIEESQHAEVMHVLAEVESAISQVAAKLALAPGEDEPVEELVACLRGWEQRRGALLGEIDVRRRRWGRLQGLLGDRTIEQLESDTSDARARADTLTLALEPHEVSAAMQSLSAEDGHARHGAALTAARDARDQFTTLSERLRLRAATMRDVATAREEHARAERELRRLQDLAEIVLWTRSFMESAVDRAHRSIAPVLQTSLTERLAAVTNGRYVEALIDPETLDVQVRPASGNWRRASGLSHGTAEQVYLLLRVALAEHLVRATETAPLMLDDVTVQSDHSRTVALMETLLSLTGSHQVIAFSQEAEVAEWARARLDGERHRLIELDELPIGLQSGAVK